MKRQLLIWALALCAACPALAQGIITGTVYEDFGGMKEPSMGVNVAVVNDQNRTLTGTTTDMDGNYSLKMPAGQRLTLVYSFIGMVTQRIPYTGQARQDVTMAEDSKTLGEVVVATQRTERTELGVSAKAFSGASQTIKMDDVLETVPVSSVEEALQGQLAGVDIIAGGDPGAKGSIRIRGTATLNTSADPLIVINGVPYNTDIADDFDFATANTEDFADMLSLNPNDIESIEVLKDASATAIYGTKGGNGVLLITTKKGQRGKPRFTFSNKTSVNFEPDPIPMLDADEYTAYMQDAIWNTANARGLQSSGDLLNMLFSEKSYAIGYQPDWVYFDEYQAHTDWLGHVRQNVVQTDNNFSMSGGGDKATYRFSLGYTTQDGTTRGTGLTRLTSTLRIGYDFSDRLNITSEFTYSDTQSDASYFKSEQIRTEAMRKMPNKSPFYVDDATGRPTDIYFTYQDANEFQGAFDAGKAQNFHPLAAVETSRNDTGTKEEKITFSPTYRLLWDADKVPILTLKGYVSMRFKTVKTRKFLPQEVTGVTIEDTSSNLAYDGYTNSFSLQTQTQLLLTKGWRDNLHNLTASALWKTEQGSSSSYATTVYGAASAGMTDPTTGGTIHSGSLGSGSSENRTLSAIGSFTYTYDQWLSLTGTLNYEGTSAIARDERWGVFPAAGLAMNVQDLPAVRESDRWDWLDQAKIRLSWGQVGTPPSGVAPYIGTYAALDMRYGTYSPIVPQKINLTALKWQTLTDKDLGVDLALWGNRVKMTFDYYIRDTKDLLQKNTKISGVSAFKTIAFTNDGAMNNTGWEYRIDWEAYKSKTWRVALNFNINRNEQKIKRLPGNITSENYSFKNGTYANKNVEGTPVGSFFGYRYLGVYQNLEETYARDAEGNVMLDINRRPLIMQNGTIQCYPGDARYEDINHDGVIDRNDIVYLGNCNPVVNGGGGAQVGYKSAVGDFTLTVTLHYRLGQKVVNSSRMSSEAMYNTDNQSKAVLRRWRNEGDQTDIPRALYGYGYNYLGSDRFVEDCSFVRLKNLSLSYKMPKKWCERWHSQGLTVFVTGYDLFTFTDYTGQDPEVTLPTDLNKIAEDKSSTPRARRIAAGITLNF